MADHPPLLILFDGDCPLCLRKVEFLKRRDKKRRLAFADIRAPGFRPDDMGIPMAVLERQIHAVRPDGSVIGAMEVVRAASREVGLGWLAAPTGWPLLKPAFDALYRFVARHRRFLSRIF